MNNPENISIMKDHYQELYFKETIKNEELLIQNNKLKNKIDELILIAKEIIYEEILDLSNNEEIALYKKIIDITDF